MKGKRENIVLQILWGILALYFFNISIDAPNIDSICGKDIVYNEQNSIIELIIEKGLDFEHAINDYDTEDSAETLIKKNLIDFFILYPHEHLTHKISFVNKQKTYILKQLHSLLLLCCFSPPPEH